jgi:hypothetical protein
LWLANCCWSFLLCNLQLYNWISCKIMKLNPFVLFYMAQSESEMVMKNTFKCYSHFMLIIIPFSRKIYCSVVVLAFHFEDLSRSIISSLLLSSYFISFYWFYWFWFWFWLKFEQQITKPNHSRSRISSLIHIRNNIWRFITIHVTIPN